MNMRIPVAQTIGDNPKTRDVDPRTVPVTLTLEQRLIDDLAKLAEKAGVTIEEWITETIWHQVDRQFFCERNHPVDVTWEKPKCPSARYSSCSVFVPKRQEHRLEKILADATEEMKSWDDLINLADRQSRLPYLTRRIFGNLRLVPKELLRTIRLRLGLE